MQGAEKRHVMTMTIEILTRIKIMITKVMMIMMAMMLVAFSSISDSNETVAQQ